MNYLSYIQSVYVYYYSISHLVQLEILDVSYNEDLQTLPDDFFKDMTSLKKLYMSSCNLSSLPDR